MDILKKTFEISVELDAGNVLNLTVFHETETFDFSFNGQNVSLLNNGDNSWSIVSGTIGQEDVNAIGEEIEKHYNNLEL